jgi:hypothetical protein
MTTKPGQVHIARLIRPGHRITADVLEWVAATYGMNEAKWVDHDSGPCPRCAINTYRSVLCDQCREELEAPEYEGSIAEQDADSAGWGAIPTYRARGDNGWTTEE